MYTQKDCQSLITIFLDEIPVNHRKQLWLIGSGAKREMLLNFPGYYHKILNEYPEYIPSIYEQAIEKDLYRTFPDEEFFQNKENIAKLKNVLIAFSRKNSTIGYNQGFNFIVGRILQVVNDDVKIFLYNKFFLIGRNILDF